MRQHDRQVLPPVKDFVMSVTEEIEEIWVLRVNIDNIHKTKTIRDKVLKLFNFWQGAVKALQSKKSVSSSFTESLDELFDVCCSTCEPTSISFHITVSSTM